MQGAPREMLSWSRLEWNAAVAQHFGFCHPRFWVFFIVFALVGDVDFVSRCESQWQRQPLQEGSPFRCG